MASSAAILTYVDDVVDAFLRAGASDTVNGMVLNLGGQEPVSLLDLAQLVVEIAGKGEVQLIPWPENRQRIDVGDVYSSYDLIRQTLGLDAGHATSRRLGTHDQLLRDEATRLPMPDSIPIVDLKAAHAELQTELEAAALEVLRSGWYILGPQVRAFEEEFAAWLGLPAGSAVGVASGTDALLLALRACDLAPGDEVIVPSHTAVATVAAVELAGARPVFADIRPDTFTLDPDSVAAAIGPRTRAIVPVHLYGQAADLDALSTLAKRHGAWLIEDCAQAHGARLPTHAGVRPARRNRRRPGLLQLLPHQEPGRGRRWRHGRHPQRRVGRTSAASPRSTAGASATSAT